MLNSKTRKTITRKLLQDMREIISDDEDFVKGTDYLLTKRVSTNDDELRPEVTLNLLPGVEPRVRTGQVITELTGNGNVRFNQATEPAPSLIMLRGNVTTTGAILFRDESRPDEDQWVKQQLNPNQQAILDKFCTQQTDTLQSIVLGEYDLDQEDEDETNGECEAETPSSCLESEPCAKESRHGADDEENEGKDFDECGPDCEACRTEGVDPGNSGPLAKMYEEMKMVAHAMFGSNVPDNITINDVMNANTLAANGQEIAAESESLTGNLVTMCTLLARVATIAETIEPQFQEMKGTDRDVTVVRHIYETMKEMSQEWIVINMGTIAKLLGDEHAANVLMEQAVEMTSRDLRSKDGDY